MKYTEAYEFLVSVIGGVPYGVIAIDMEGYITMINDEARKALDIEDSANKIIETFVLDVFEGLEDVKVLLEKCLDKGRKTFELLEIPKGEKYLNFTGAPILSGMLISINDITDTKNARDEATKALIVGQEMERRRLSKEIHDGIGPLMSTIKLNLDSVKNELKDAPDKTLQKVGTMSDLIQDVAADLRSISHALMPSALIDFGLVAPLTNICKKASESELVQVDFFHKGLEKRLDKNIELNLYRVTQELLNNALKYSQAKTIQIQIIKSKKKVTLTVDDDGVGFDPKAFTEKMQNGIGFRNINTRVSSLGGILDIDTRPGHGVHFNIEIPL